MWRVSLLALAACAAAPPPAVAVSAVRVGGVLDGAAARAIGAVIEEAVVASGRYPVLGRGDRQRLEEELEQQLLDGCEDCVDDLGRLGAAMVVTGDVARIGGAWTLRVKLLEVRSSVILESASGSCRGEPECLLSLAARVTGAVLGSAGEAPLDTGGEPLAPCRDPTACVRAGLASDDPAFAAECFARACRARSAYACGLLAEAYRDGRGVDPDPARALVLYGQSCEAGEPEACLALGALQEAAAPAHALVAYGRACDGNQARACTRLGILYERGSGAPADLVAALGYYRRGCEGGDGQGCGRLQRMVE